jgi:hypothetical protein
MRMPRAIVGTAITVLFACTPAAAVCPGDCNVDGVVVVNEIVLGVMAARGPAAMARCPAADANDDDVVTVEELVGAVDAALRGCPWAFTDVTAAAGLASRPDRDLSDAVGSVAAADYDGDGDIDLYVTRAPPSPHLLFENRGDGTFEDVAGAAGVAGRNETWLGPTFADADGDGALDLFVGGADGAPARLFRNRGDRTFEDVTGLSGIDLPYTTLAAAFGDYDRDGWLDLLVTHYLVPFEVVPVREYLWRNTGAGRFTPVSAASNVTGIRRPERNTDFTFTPNFADLDNDGWLDVLFASDFDNSLYFLNQRDGTFANATTDVISDENGMGVALGDYDRDGDLDWFVTSIWDPAGAFDSWGGTGNRLYRNRGDGTFEDATDAAGVREGDFGWGACFADFNNDGWLDLFHVNGFETLDVRAERYRDDPSRLFVAIGDGRFVERSAALGLDDRGLGWGVACFDYDRDGDSDLFVANVGQPPHLYRNDGGNRLNYLQVKLRGSAPNTEGIGARLYARTGDVTQMWEIRAGNNFVSQDPAEAHFGLGTATRVDELRIVWPQIDAEPTVLRDVPVNRLLVIAQPSGRRMRRPDGGSTWGGSRQRLRRPAGSAGGGAGDLPQYSNPVTSRPTAWLSTPSATL